MAAFVEPLATTRNMRVTTSSESDEMSEDFHCSVRLLLPFTRVLQSDPRIPSEILAPLASTDPEGRLPLLAVHEILERATALTRDADIGLRAAQAFRPGDYGAVEYAARTAANILGAAHVIARYLPILNDALELSLREEAEYALIKVSSKITMPRAATDFIIGALYVSSRCVRSVDNQLKAHVWFSHAEPESVEEYAKTFEGANVRFGAPWNGFVAPRAYLSIPSTGADPRLHEVVRRYADLMLSRL